MRRSALLLCIGILLAGCARDAPPVAGPGDPNTPGTEARAIELEPFLDGFERPLLLTHRGIEGEHFLVEQGGRIWRVAGDAREVWLDVSDATRAGGERGLLGLAFEPERARAYIAYTDEQGDLQIERLHEDMRRERILSIAEPFSNHNGGHLAFGPDGFLYIGVGDGGAAGDPQGNGQDTNALLGSLLRLDVSGEESYQIPSDNAWREAWAKGLRNPWRFSFDRATGDLYLGDVGQQMWEEIDFLAAGTPSGTNFGWNVFEGTHRYKLLGDTFSTHTPPVAEYSHEGGNCSVTGGHVYRGADSPGLDGIYFFGDYCSGKMWSMRRVNDTWSVVELLDTDLSISSFGEDASGEVYVVAHQGIIYKIIEKK